MLVLDASLHPRVNTGNVVNVTAHSESEHLSISLIKERILTELTQIALFFFLPAGLTCFKLFNEALLHIMRCLFLQAFLFLSFLGLFLLCPSLFLLILQHFNDGLSLHLDL